MPVDWILQADFNRHCTSHAIVYVDIPLSSATIALAHSRNPQVLLARPSVVWPRFRCLEISSTTLAHPNTSEEPISTILTCHGRLFPGTSTEVSGFFRPSTQSKLPLPFWFTTSIVYALAHLQHPQCLITFWLLDLALLGHFSPSPCISQNYNLTIL